MPLLARISLASLCLLALAPAAAHAGDIDMSATFQSYTYKAKAGEANHVELTQSGTTVVVTDTGAPVALGAETETCARTGPAQVTCTVPDNYTLKVSVGDLDDSVSVAADSDTKLEGGTGSDTLLSGSGDDNLIGDPPSGAGNDVLDGGAGEDKFTGGDGDDQINARDGVGEPLSCGVGADSATTDTFDTSDADCETVDAVYMGPAPGSTPPGGTDDTGTGSSSGSGAGPLGNGDASAVLPPPELGVSVNVAAGLGSVKVKLPGTGTWVPLSGGAEIPVGSVIDATQGPVTLTSALDEQGNVQSGTFWGGAFMATQKPSSGMVTVAMRGGDFSPCRARAAADAASAARSRTVRRLWARDRGGRFRSRGRNSHATVRGTTWLTADRCDGTVTRVKDGKVAVRDYARKRTVLVRAGQSYLARKR